MKTAVLFCTVKFFLQKGLQKHEKYDIISLVVQGYSSVGRVLVSKTMGRGFKSFCPCQKIGKFRLADFFIQAAGLVYHHALACISSPQAYIINRRLYRFRNDDIQTFGLMIYRNKLRMIYKATP